MNPTGRNLPHQQHIPFPHRLPAGCGHRFNQVQIHSRQTFLAPARPVPTAVDVVGKKQGIAPAVEDLQTVAGQVDRGEIGQKSIVRAVVVGTERVGHIRPGPEKHPDRVTHRAAARIGETGRVGPAFRHGQFRPRAAVRPLGLRRRTAQAVRIGRAKGRIRAKKSRGRNLQFEVEQAVAAVHGA